MYRIREAGIEVLLIHPGGPYNARKDAGVWSIPKGLFEKDEDGLAAAKREFREELGSDVPAEDFLPLGPVTQKGGKIVHAWAFQGDWVEGTVNRCNTFKIEWPPKSGNICEFKEIDRVGFFTLEEARSKLKDTQWPLVERLVRELG